MRSQSETQTRSIGWRLRTLRLRHKMTLVEVAGAADLDVSYLSRLERDALQNAKPKPDTISRVLDAMSASLLEREAVYHFERPPITSQEIETEVCAVGPEIEHSPEALLIGDERWYLHFYNRTARAILGLSPAEYPGVRGLHMLHALIDPTQPRYTRVPDGERERAFRVRAQMFKTNFAGEEFDNWYLEIVRTISLFPWAATIWEHTFDQERMLVIGRDDVTILNPLAGSLSFRFQLNRLMSNPRFFLASWTPLDDETAQKVADLKDRAEFAYSVAPLIDDTPDRLRTRFPVAQTGDGASGQYPG